MQGRYQIL